MADPNNTKSTPQLDLPTNAASVRHPSDDVENCRICRGEGTKEEPLFYPCKCSGSIKWVHQNCLLEWLSYKAPQRKHCELCKTTFTFTKLYDADMPGTLPTTVFMRRAGLHVLQKLLTALRGLLVTFIWLLWLPWSMRFVWKGLFWLGDGGWARQLNGPLTHNSSEAYFSSVLSGNTTGGNLTNSTFVNDTALVTFKLPGTAVAPLTLTLVRAILKQLPWISNLIVSSAADLEDGAVIKTRQWERDSLLSGFSLLNHLTAQPKLNKLIVDVLEGQIITSLVVVTFILIFLIREWVVQQQPIIQGALAEPDEEARLADVGGPAAAQVELQVNELVQTEELDEDARVDQHDEGHEAELDGEVSETVEAREAGESELVDEPIGTSPLLRQPSEYSDKAIGRLIHDLVARRDALESLDMVYSAEEADRIKAKLDANKLSSTARKIALACFEALTVASEKQDLEALESFSNILSRFDEVTHSLPEKDLSGADAVDVKLSIQTLRDWSTLEIQNIRSEHSGQRRSSTTKVATELHRRHYNALYSPSSSEDNHVEGSSWTSGNPFMTGRAHSSLAAMLQGELEGGEPSETDPKHATITAKDDTNAWSEADAVAHPVRAPADEAGDFEDVVIAGASHVDLGDTTPQRLAAERDNFVEIEESGSTHQGQITGVGIPAQGQLSIQERVLDWMLGDVSHSQTQPVQDENDEHIVQDLAAEDPFVPFADGEFDRLAEILAEGDEDIRDPEVLAAAAEAGIDPNDPEAADELEELEGVMELIGMQGPLSGLFQNAVFSAVLISATVAVMVWFPYLWGKVVLLFLANPIQFAVKVPLQFISGISNLTVDLCIFSGCIAVYWTEIIVWFVLDYTLQIAPNSLTKFLGSVDLYARSVSESATIRMAESFLLVSVDVDSDYLHLSVSSHEALMYLKLQCSALSSIMGNSLQNCYVLTTSSSLDTVFKHGGLAIQQLFVGVFKHSSQSLSGLQSGFVKMLRSGSLTLNLNNSAAQSPLNADLIHWSATDRFIAVFAGYVFFALIGAMYLRRKSPFTSSAQGRKVEGIITEVLQQAGGVLKVILIISIEMLVFPLYCGLLLDIAMLPLFAGATVVSRVTFTAASPWTSFFVHWFVGTCYMFHFALFVSMCRKILRSGVLYFIRDPDDPTFHPVRDVLERNVATQLRKIAFSALVYGALVILCLGSVVWSVYYLVDGVLPIEWLSSRPIVAFPIDLLLYNFLTPLIIHVLKPSQGLQVMYEGWFRQCAKLLRLSHFLFNEEVMEEIRRNDDTVVGRFVRAPASDSVRIPKDRTVFLEVTENNERVDGKTDLDAGVHGRTNDQYIKLYIPPWFRIRIGLFVFCVWALTAAVGLGVTVLPLVFGRLILSRFVPTSREINDIYAYSLGMFVIGTTTYLLSERRRLMASLKMFFHNHFATALQAARTLKSIAISTLLTTYTYTALVILIPTLLAFLLELYVVMPLHAYHHGVAEPYTMYFLQDWTLGILYLRIAVRIITAYPDARPARAIAAIVEKGWLRPNARLATRAFILPSCVVAGLALVAPIPLAWLAERFYFASEAERASACAQRFAYPALLATGLGLYIVSALVDVARKWRRRIRDEAYLIGERLHNYGERRQQDLHSGSGGPHSVASGRRLEA